jgi:hypothetical protein
MVGRATITIQPEGGETINLTVKYVVVWERDSADGLTLAVDMWNGESAGRACLWVPETAHAAADLPLRSPPATGMIRRWRYS